MPRIRSRIYVRILLAGCALSLGCISVETDGLRKDMRKARILAESEDPGDCGGISDGKKRNTCALVVAMRTQDIDACKNIEDM